MARKPKQVSAAWRKILLAIPGYDPFAQAGDCWFDADRAQLAIAFVETCIHHVEGAGVAGKPFLLELWEKAIVANLFGWVRRDDKGRIVRRFRELLVYVPRKNGKTALTAALVILSLFFDREPGAQIFSAASEREQASLVFRHVQGMIGQAPALERRCKIYRALRAVELTEDKASVYRAISAEAYSKHGLNCQVAVVDELHTQPNRDLVEVLKTSMGARAQPMMIYLTTADWLRESICNETYEYACRVRDNSMNPAIGANDPTFLPVIYEAGKDDDWKSEDVWRKANPNLGVTVSLEFLRAECRQAQEVPAKENGFRRLYLNQRTEQDSRAIPMDQWGACGGVGDPAEWRKAALSRLAGQECFAGLDLGATNDLTALVLLFTREKPWTVLPFFWVTAEAVERRRKARVRYDDWAAQGFVRVTDGNVTDYDQVRADIGKLANDYGIRDLAIDRLFQGAQLATQLMDDGLNVVAFGQGFLSMASPSKRLLELVAAAELDHGGNPVLSWHAGNAATEMDAAGNIKFSKAKSTEKIDGIVALTMAIGRSEQAPPAIATTVEVW